jgi:hypothetical protein
VPFVPPEINFPAALGGAEFGGLARLLLNNTTGFTAGQGKRIFPQDESN